MRKSLVLIGIVLPIVLVAVNIAVGKSPVIATVLIGIALLILIGWSCYLLFKTLHIRLSFSHGQAKAAFLEIYELAKKHGGYLCASHISPLERVTRPDDIPEKLRNLDVPLDYHRLLFIDDPILQDAWVRRTLGLASDKLKVTVSYSTGIGLVSRFVWRVIPRFNLLLYRSPKGHVTRTLLGLHRIYTEETQRDGQPQRKTPNFNITFSSSKLFSHLLEYFHAFAEGAVFDKASSLEEYDRKSHIQVFQTKFRSFLSRLLALCASNTNILHCSVFGYSAMYQEGVHYIDCFKTDLDVDLILVCTRGNKESVREDLKNNRLLRENMPFSFQYVWGDDPEEFYSPRGMGTFTVDVELFEEGDQFFRQHPLLGHSILSSCVALYQQAPSLHRLHQLMAQPELLPTVQRRMQVLINDRKGLLDFTESFKQKKGHVDPRRICAHVVRNLAWAWSGTIYSSYEQANKTLLDLPVPEEMRNSLKKCEVFMKKERSINNFEKEYRDVNNLLKSALDFCKSACEEGVPNKGIQLTS